jgi:hypothetical protein
MSVTQRSFWEMALIGFSYNVDIQGSVALRKIELPLKSSGHQKCDTKQVLRRGPGMCRPFDKEFSRPSELPPGFSHFW